MGRICQRKIVLMDLCFTFQCRNSFLLMNGYMHSHLLWRSFKASYGYGSKLAELLTCKSMVMVWSYSLFWRNGTKMIANSRISIRQFSFINVKNKKKYISFFVQFVANGPYSIFIIFQKPSIVHLCVLPYLHQAVNAVLHMDLRVRLSPWPLMPETLKRIQLLIKFLNFFFQFKNFYQGTINTS